LNIEVFVTAKRGVTYVLTICFAH